MFALSPWLQLPIVLAIALPVAGVAAWAMLRVTDWLAYQLTRARAERSRKHLMSATEETPSTRKIQPVGRERAVTGEEIPPKRGGEVD